MGRWLQLGLFVFLPACVADTLLLEPQPLFDDAGTALELRLEEITEGAAGECASRVCLLPPLSHEDVGAYIQRKLDSAGYRGSELFDPEAVRRVARHSHGLPKRVDTFCGMALLIAYDVGRTKVDGETMAEAVDDLEGGVEGVPSPSQPTNVTTPLKDPGPAATGGPPHRAVARRFDPRACTGVQKPLRRAKTATECLR